MPVQYGTDQEVLRELTRTLPVETVKWQLTVMQASPTAMWDCYCGYCELAQESTRSVSCVNKLLTSVEHFQLENPDVKSEENTKNKQGSCRNEPQPTET